MKCPKVRSGDEQDQDEYKFLSRSWSLTKLQYRESESSAKSTYTCKSKSQTQKGSKEFSGKSPLSSHKTTLKVKQLLLLFHVQFLSTLGSTWQLAANSLIQPWVAYFEFDTNITTILLSLVVV